MCRYWPDQSTHQSQSQLGVGADHLISPNLCQLAWPSLSCPWLFSLSSHSHSLQLSSRCSLNTWKESSCSNLPLSIVISKRLPC